MGIPDFRLNSELSEASPLFYGRHCGEQSMNKIESLSKQLSLSPVAEHTISKILNRVDETILNTWLEKLQIKDGRIVGTFYSELGATVPFSDFVVLYQALGYDFGTLALWKDWWCYGAEGCKSQSGYTCDTSTC